MKRRDLLVGAAAAGMLPMSGLPTGIALAQGKVPKPYSWDLMPPTDSRESFINWMVQNRGEAASFKGLQWERYQAILRNKDLWDEKTKRAFLLVPREEFASVSASIKPRAYEHAFLDIGYGVTMSGPHLQSRMTNVIDVKRGERVLEIGTGSGTQAAYLANLTEHTYTIEIIRALADRTRGIYDGLIARGYSEYKHISTKAADGYYGWQEAAPFDKIIVTCGIDHIPPPLLQQLKTGGTMVIPVGPPGQQRVLKVVKQQAADASISVTREDIYGGKIVPFVPFTKDGGGNHNRGV